MAYRVKIHKSVAKKLAGWLPDFLIVDAHLRLQDHLSSDPWRILQRVTEPFDGMIYAFSLVDPQDRLCEHFLLFQVVYAQDEETLIVIRCGYRRRSG